MHLFRSAHARGPPRGSIGHNVSPRQGVVECAAGDLEDGVIRGRMEVKRSGVSELSGALELGRGRIAVILEHEEAANRSSRIGSVIGGIPVRSLSSIGNINAVSSRLPPESCLFAMAICFVAARL